MSVFIFRPLAKLLNLLLLALFLCESRAQEANAGFAVDGEACDANGGSCNQQDKQEKNEKEAPKPPVYPPVRVLLFYPPSILAYSSEIHIKGQIRGCAAQCEFLWPEDKDTEVLQTTLRGQAPVPQGVDRLMKSADAVLFDGAQELMTLQEHLLPKRSYDGQLFGGCVREPLPTAPISFWRKYDMMVTYELTPVQKDLVGFRRHHVTHGYLPSAQELLNDARRTPGYGKRRGDALIAFVSRRCGERHHTQDGRSNRTHYVKKLMKLGDSVVGSYGNCVRNRPWPEGYNRDKSHVMKQHKFCLAIENTDHDDYVTEKLWDCLRAGAVPIYRGASNVEHYLPGGRQSAIFVDDFATPSDLVAHLKRVESNKTLWWSYRQWLKKHEVGEAMTQKWLSFMAENEANGAACRVCNKVSEVKAQRR
eukprot:TRINITY_DN97559_c0_g1_i1.p1 TRINITY_DN97559_c0_g1~~TRINITY_DN97559_c0_g1_i1.p1  ORF type:complete len:438 (+),score=67.22 TRINITY_DN97559_c0_g1_i1:57-1316(+)